MLDDRAAGAGSLEDVILSSLRKEGIESGVLLSFRDGNPKRLEELLRTEQQIWSPFTGKDNR
ncbi:hypothetical protein PGTUg99_005913 [Puccinia graminis f. sp. tritici]|uniref:Uncharacterized protein n=1 Tax=Puccinia graminis f. sp. tritici TaxID=56615 RepID=A0A5B0PSU8_PUCGR|nr:hypothetical protein PGTUg99_005913 [Puccinia graminis f. sp. tritici]